MVATFPSTAGPPGAPTGDAVAGPRPLRIAAQDGAALAGDRWSPAPAAAAAGRPAVLFAHGFGQTRLAWQASARRLAASGYEALAFDGRGHGDSDWNPPATPYVLEQFVDDTRCLAAAAPERPVWVGASMGGLLGLLAAGESADAAGLGGLVLVDITPRWESAGVERILGFMRAHPQGFDSLHQAADAIAAHLPHRPRKTPEQLSSLLLPNGRGRLRWHWDPRLLDEMAAHAAAWQARLAAAATRLSIPTLLVSGGDSDLVSDTTVAEFLALAPHATHVRIAGATHMVAGDRNDLFTDTILDFLEAQIRDARRQDSHPEPLSRDAHASCHGAAP